MEVPLTPLEFARRARACMRIVRRSWTVRCASPTRASSTGATGGRRRFSGRGPSGRPGRLHLAQHSRAARVVLRGAADRRGAGADQFPAQPDDFAYIINHSGATVVCAHDDSST